jgi:DNA topoisomerase IB
MRTDNTYHLLAAARQRSEKARQQVEEALKQLDQTTQPATVSELVRTAGVSRSWLYTQPHLLEQLQQRKRPGRTSPSGSSVRASEASIHRRLQLAHQRIRQLTDENRRLQERLARAHGALRDARR